MPPVVRSVEDQASLQRTRGGVNQIRADASKVGSVPVSALALRMSCCEETASALGKPSPHTLVDERKRASRVSLATRRLFQSDKTRTDHAPSGRNRTSIVARFLNHARIETTSITREPRDFATAGERMWGSSTSVRGTAKDRSPNRTLTLAHSIRKSRPERASANQRLSMAFPSRSILNTEIGWSNAPK